MPTKHGAKVPPTDPPVFTMDAAKGSFSLETIAHIAVGDLKNEELIMFPGDEGRTVNPLISGSAQKRALYQGSQRMLRVYSPVTLVGAPESWTRMSMFSAGDRLDCFGLRWLQFNGGVGQQVYAQPVSFESRQPLYGNAQGLVLHRSRSQQSCLQPPILTL